MKENDLRTMNREQRHELLENAGWRWVTSSLWRHPRSECSYTADGAMSCGHLIPESAALLRVLADQDTARASRKQAPSPKQSHKHLASVVDAQPDTQRPRCDDLRDNACIVKC